MARTNAVSSRMMGGGPERELAQPQSTKAIVDRGIVVPVNWEPWNGLPLGWKPSQHMPPLYIVLNQVVLTRVLKRKNPPSTGFHNKIVFSLDSFNRADSSST